MANIGVQQGATGKQVGQVPAASAGEFGDVLVTEYQARFYQQNQRGLMFTGGLTALTSINAATFTTATLGATATPVLGIWNQGSSKVNLSILQASLSISLTALTATGPGGFIWAVSTGNNSLTLGTAPFSRSTLTASGSSAKNMSGVALTGLTNNLALMTASALQAGQPYSVSEISTAAGFMTQISVDPENLDGSIIVPPGGVLALLATTTPVAHSAVGSLLWAEVPV